MTASSDSGSMTVRLLMAYEGGRFAGWQRQPNTDETVQERLEEALQELLQQPVRAIASGRTDAGVHATGQVVHVEVSPSEGGEIELMKRLVLGSNALLPSEIRVLRADRMPRGFDARKCAKSKLYRYRWWRSPVVPPHEVRYVAQLTAEPDVSAMRVAAARMVGRHDFAAMAKSGGAHRSSVRTVTRVELSEDREELRLEVEGEGFLRGMVRAMAGTLLEVGRGKRSVESIDRLLGRAAEEAGRRSDAGPNAPARGLVLVRVDYESQWTPLAVGFPDGNS